MTAKTITVRAQWALHGKVLDNQGYQIIACSSGDLNKANFTEAVGRFALGAVDMLPQVSVSYLQPATRPGGGYLALAIHWSAGSGKRYAEGVSPVDDHGRPTTFTSYFCAPYAALAPHRISYLDMYKAFSAVTLSVKDGPPRDVLLMPPRQRVPAVGDLATRVAPLLLTGMPVCVLGADDTSLDERLRFIDTVMGLLPYGFRAKMAAATWTRATNRDHRFRLFFSSEPRAGDKQDHVVSWTDPEQAHVPQHGDVYRYYQWLTDKISPLAGLTALNTEAGFGDSADSQAYQMVTRWRLRAPTAPRSPGKDLPALASPAAKGADQVAGILNECAEHLRMRNSVRVREDVTVLKDLMKFNQVSADLRKRYRLLIARHGLLDSGSGLKRKEESDLYETLLTLAFGKPVTYEGLCQVEHCLGVTDDRPVHKSLLEAIVQVGLGDLRTRVLVQSSLDPRKLPKPLGSIGSDAHALISELARGGWRQQHGRVFCDVTLRYLRAKENKYSTRELQRDLLSHGYLAQALRGIGHEQYQVHAITLLLVAAFPKEKYPGGLDRTSFTEILARSPVAPTPALLSAILCKIPATEAPDAWDAFIYGSVAGMKLDEKTRADVLPQLPSIEPGQSADGQPAEARQAQEPEAFRETTLLGPLSMKAGPPVPMESGPPTEPGPEQGQQQATWFSWLAGSWPRPGQEPGSERRQALSQGPEPALEQQPPEWEEPWPGYYQGMPTPDDWSD